MSGFVHVSSPVSATSATSSCRDTRHPPGQRAAWVLRDRANGDPRGLPIEETTGSQAGAGDELAQAALEWSHTQDR
jgi:hypothetical protein